MCPSSFSASVWYIVAGYCTFLLVLMNVCVFVVQCKQIVPRTLETSWLSFYCFSKVNANRNRSCNLILWHRNRWDSCISFFCEKQTLQASLFIAGGGWPFFCIFRQLFTNLGFLELHLRCHSFHASGFYCRCSPSCFFNRKKQLVLFFMCLL